jgi:predicted lipid-binding transport protein (Tim44 family)
MQQPTYTTTPIAQIRSGLRSRLILPAAIAELRAALEARVAQAPDDIAARVSLGELNLSVSLAAAARATRNDEPIGSPNPDLLRARHVVPALALIARRK